MPRLLIVEDQTPLLESLTRGLREEGYEVLPAATVAQALVHIREKPVDVIVLDLMLPDRDGLSLIRELRATGFANPILIITARDAVEDRVAGLDAGADDYLIKPFS
ncbi:MAG: mprA 2, partial [Planctomycetaceae bacterium]|nr:mprA 2 [Planctomycetaceae bacterium]